MNWLKWIPTLALGAAMCAHAAGEYPEKPVRFIVPAPAGGPSDVIARLVARELTRLGQAVVVDNRPGASQTLGTAMVAKAVPDGYTLLFTTSTPIVMAPFTMKGLTYDVRRDLVLVAHVGWTPLVLYANAGMPATSVKELTALAKESPRGINYGSYGTGSSGHLLVELLAKRTGTQYLHVPYKGVAPELNALVAGEVQLGVAESGVPMPLVKAGKLIPLAVSGNVRTTTLPDVATFAEQGVSGMESFSPWWGLFAPAGTPQPVVDKLSAEVVRIVKSPQFAGQLASLGVEATGLPSKAATEVMTSDIRRWQKIIGELADLRLD